MVKGFSERERIHIRKLLIEKGKELFGLYGLKKTSISELTEAVGIAQGSFYLFFDSKEELYFDVLSVEEQVIKSKLFASQPHLLSGRVSKKDFAQFLLKAVELIENNPFMKTMFIGDDYDMLIRKLPKEKMQEHIQNDHRQLEPLVKYWQEHKMMVQKKPEVIGGIFRTFIMMMLHKKEIGEDIHRETMQCLAECIAEGLIIERK